MIEAFDPGLQWIVIAAFSIAFLLAFSVGANDVSNSFGTSVGSKVLTVTQACILATFFEVTGATLLGYEVCDTFRRRMLDYELYEGSEKELVLGFFSCLIGSSLWNFIATKMKMPISGTHSVIGATIGFALISRGFDSIKWAAMARIVASWFASPVLSGLCSSIIYVVISKFVLTKSDPLEPGLKILPIFYGITIFINVSSLVIGGPKALYLDGIPWWMGLLIATGAALLAAYCIVRFLVDRLRSRIKKEMSINMKPPRASIGGGGGGGGHDNKSYKFDQDDFAPPKAGPSNDVDLGVSKSTSTSQSPTSKLTSSTVNRPPPVAIKPASLRQYPQKKDARGITKIYVPGPSSSQPQQQQQQQQQTQTQGQIGSAQDAIDVDPIVSGMQKLGAQECRVNLESVSTRSKRQRHQRTAVELHDVHGDNIINNNRGEGAGGGSFLMGERLEIYRLFAPLQIMTACFASFAHGTNDVSNAVAPLAPIWFIYVNGKENLDIETPIWILFFGGIGICTGLWAWGRSVMNTLGSGLTKLTASKGFAIELGAATAVLCATKLGLPISTTHCKVGSVVIVALVASKFCANDSAADDDNNYEQTRQEPREPRTTTRSDQSIHIKDEATTAHSILPTTIKNNDNIKDSGSKTTLALGGSRYQTKQHTASHNGDKQQQRQVDDNSVEWGMFGSIVVSWIVTVPFAALSSALTMFILTRILL